MKRFTDTEKWRDPWFRKLPPAQKCFWQYLCDNCDHAGIWEPDIETASYFIGSEIDTTKALIAFQGRIETLPCGKWRIVKFVKFQYGRLSRDCKPHNPVFACIEKHGYKTDAFENGIFLLPESSKAIDTLSKGIQCLVVKENDKVTVKEEEEGSGPDVVAIPDNLDTEAFKAAWANYLAYRTERHLAKLKPRSESLQLEKLSGWGPDAAIIALKETISNGWQGVFPPKAGCFVPNASEALQPGGRAPLVPLMR